MKTTPEDSLQHWPCTEFWASDKVADQDESRSNVISDKQSPRSGKASEGLKDSHLATCCHGSKQLFGPAESSPLAASNAPMNVNVLYNLCFLALFRREESLSLKQLQFPATRAFGDSCHAFCKHHVSPCEPCEPPLFARHEVGRWLGNGFGCMFPRQNCVSKHLSANQRLNL